MPATIKPTIGRIVEFYKFLGDTPKPAIITKVWSDACINIGTWDEQGAPIPNPPQCVRLLEPGETITSEIGPYCCWPDYQSAKAQQFAEKLDKIPSQQLAQKVDEITSRSTEMPIVKPKEN